MLVIMNNLTINTENFKNPEKNELHEKLWVFLQARYMKST